MLKLEWVASMGWVSVFQRFSISAFQRVFSRPGVGFVHSSLRQDASLEAGEGANRLTKHAQATRCRKNDGLSLANLPAGDTPRVSLRSPVREYCTPGSVRGAPGNRCPYLDMTRGLVQGDLDTIRNVGLGFAAHQITDCLDMADVRKDLAKSIGESRRTQLSGAKHLLIVFNTC